VVQLGVALSGFSYFRKNSWFLRSSLERHLVHTFTYKYINCCECLPGGGIDPGIRSSSMLKVPYGSEN